CVSRYAAICAPPQTTAELITDAARAAVDRAGRRPGAVAPHHVEVEFDATHLAAAAAVVPTVERTGPRRVGFDAASMTLAMQAFKIVTAIAAGAVEGIYG
ncbi:MAG: peptide ABC transporter substrate-binding protein, partial [Saccharothrix sp.]|nr:peptide ABC transporter substrate-binding protein [Saccharothrix sp.]